MIESVQAHRSVPGQTMHSRSSFSLNVPSAGSGPFRRSFVTAAKKSEKEESAAGRGNHWHNALHCMSAIVDVVLLCLNMSLVAPCC